MAATLHRHTKDTCPHHLPDISENPMPNTNVALVHLAPVSFIGTSCDILIKQIAGQ